MTKSQTFEIPVAVAQFFVFIAVMRDAKEETAKFSCVKCPKTFKINSDNPQETSANKILPPPTSLPELRQIGVCVDSFSYSAVDAHL